MKKDIITAEKVEAFACWLKSNERAPGTIEMYCRDMLRMKAYLGENPLTKESAAQYKEHLLTQNLTPSTINTILAALNAFLRFDGQSYRIKALRVQRRVFRDDSLELTREEFNRMVETAQTRGDYRLALLMETIASTGIRVSELPYITVEAVNIGRARISLKGKIREILLPGKLCRKLLKYTHKNKIASGAIFITESGKSMSRKQVWAKLKALSKWAGVAASKVFPHNLRHLFARVFYRASHDIVKLADLLGHSSIVTTRLYLVESGDEHIRQLDSLRLVQ